MRASASDCWTAKWWLSRRTSRPYSMRCGPWIPIQHEEWHSRLGRSNRIGFYENTMGIAFFPSLAQADIVEVSVSRRQGGETILRLVVDSGFTGESSFVLAKDAIDLALMPMPSLSAMGAIQGIQQRVLVFYHVAVLTVDATAIAVLAD